mmetsp:Transcript_115218/g.372753  ORF Transcript_115218/g.372753 Transcript_115218/m.372753 type:complete len:102 (+) Transcript_115218:1661-1966(+)
MNPIIDVHFPESDINPLQRRRASTHMHVFGCLHSLCRCQHCCVVVQINLEGLYDSLAAIKNRSGMISLVFFEEIAHIVCMVSSEFCAISVGSLSEEAAQRQ